jgi:hypothetical protein
MMTLSLMTLYDTKLDGIVHDGTMKNLPFHIDTQLNDIQCNDTYQFALASTDIS